MKRTLAVLLMLALSLSLLAGCQTAPKVKLLVLEESLAAEEYGIAFKKDNTALRDAVVSALDAMMADGAAAKISQQWFGKDVVLPAKEVTPATAAPEGKTTLVMGLDDSFPPMGFRNDKNEIVGFDVDLAKEVCKRLGLELKLQPIDWAAKELELANGNIDCIWNGLTITPARQEEMTISRPYLANNQVIVVSEKSGIANKASLEGKKVAVQTGSSAEEALAKDAIAEKVAEVVQFADNVSALQDLKTGRIDAVILDEIVARYYIANN